jgi:hypothetical protein
MTLVRDAKAQVTLDKREAQERASRVEVESAAVLASTSGEEEDLFWRITHLEGEPAEALQDQDMAEENSWGLLDAAARGV